MWNKKANTCGYCPATINNGEDGSYRSCEDIMTDWGWTCQEVIDMVGESFCSQCPSCDITADDGDGGDATEGATPASESELEPSDAARVPVAAPAALLAAIVVAFF